MDKKNILEKVEILEEREAFVNRCLAVKICPDCGNIVICWAACVRGRTVKTYSCTSCSFRK